MFKTIANRWRKIVEHQQGKLNDVVRNKIFWNKAYNNDYDDSHVATELI